MTLDYPPLSIEESAAVGMLYQRWSPDFQDSRVFNAAVKLPALLAELALLAAVLAIGARCFGSAAARWCALAMWLNPALIVHGAVLGYLDSPTAVPAALSLVAAYVSPAWLAGVLLGVAAASKPQAVLVARLLPSWWPAIPGLVCERSPE